MRFWLRCIGPLVLAVTLMYAPGNSFVFAQGKAAKPKPGKAPKNAKGEPAEEEGPPLEEVDFGTQLSLLADGATEELDATAEGKERLEKLEDRTKEIFREHELTLALRRPFAISRDRLLGEVVQYNQGIAQAQQAILQARGALNKLQRLINDGDNTQATQNQIQNAENQIAAANTLIADNQEEINERAPRINAYNLDMKPLEERLLKLWLELNECRTQWLQIRQPQQKYAHGNYEGLKQVINDWLLLDGVWPDARCWAALCEYELGNYREAWDHVEKAAELRTKMNFRKSWPEGDALRGLIAAKLPDRKSKSAGFIQLATLAAGKDKKTKWETFFLLGRASFENEKFAIKTKTHFEKALKINADAACVKYWYGRLQTTSTVGAVMDAETGTETLEDLWKHSTKQSWRLAQAMVLAYDASNREKDAKLTWQLVETLAPQKEHDQLKSEREEAQTKRKSAADGPATKSKKK